VIKAEWGTKRVCPKCSTRFYDLQNDDPVTCISCGFAWAPEPLLKSKQPLPFEAPKKAEKEEEDADEELTDDLELEEADAADDDDIAGDDDLSDVIDADDPDEES
jgi:hypothetical protein